MAMKKLQNGAALALLMGSVLALPACGKKEETPPAPKVAAGMDNLQQIAAASFRAAANHSGPRPLRSNRMMSADYRQTCSPRSAFHSSSINWASSSERGLTLNRMPPSLMPES